MNKPTQRAVPVAREERRQPAQASVWNRPLPRWAKWLLGLLALAVAVIVVPQMGVMHVYQRHFRGDAPEIAFRFEDLNAQMDEAALRKHVPGLTLRCMTETQSQLGNRVCYSALGRVNGDLALTLALFLRDGKLRFGVLHVPWWAHGRWQSRFMRDYGSPVAAGNDGSRMPVQRWKMPGGQVEMNKSRYWNPLEYSVILWTAER